MASLFVILLSIALIILLNLLDPLLLGNVEHLPVIDGLEHSVVTPAGGASAISIVVGRMALSVELKGRWLDVLHIIHDVE